MSQGGDLYWPAGTYVSDASIADFHSVRHIGAGVIKRAASTFKVSQRGSQENILYVDPAGNDANDGLSASEPMATLQVALNSLALTRDYLPGIWTIQLAAGTYSPASVPNALQSRNFIRIYGPSVGHPNVPTAIIDAAAASGGVCLSAAEGVRLDVRNVKVQNAVGTLSIGIVATNDCDVYLDNVHAENIYSGIQVTHNSRLRMRGGIVQNCQIGAACGVSSVFTFGYAAGGTTAGGPRFLNCATQGVKITEVSTGHVDYCIIDLCGVGIEVSQGSRVNDVGNAITNCTVAGIRATSGYVANNGNTYSGNSTNFINDGYSLYLPISTGAQGRLRVARVKTDITHTGTTSKALLATPFTIPAGYFVDSSKQLVVNIRGVINASSGIVQVGVDFTGNSMALLSSAGAVSGVRFEAEIVIDPLTSTTQRVHSKLLQGTTVTRHNRDARSINMVPSIPLQIVGLLSVASDSLVIESVDVWLAG